MPLSAQIWRAATNGLPAIQNVAGLPGMPQALGANGSNVYVGCRNIGVYKTTDSGSNWTATGSLPEFGSSTFNGIVASGSYVYAGMLPHGVARSADGGTTWTLVTNGLSGAALNVQRMLAPADGNVYIATQAKVWASAENGDSWSQLYGGAGMNDVDALSLAATTNNLYCGTYGSDTQGTNIGVFFYSPLAGGSTWKTNNNGAGTAGAHYEEAFCIAANEDNQTVFVGYDDNAAHVSHDGGMSFHKYSANNAGMRSPSADIFAMFTHGDDVFAAVRFDGVYWGTLEEQPWLYYNSGMPSGITFLNDFVWDGKKLFVSTDHGVFVTPYPFPTVYHISASRVGNGVVSPAGNLSVAPGASPSFTNMPALYFRVQSVLVDGVASGTNSAYTFSNVQTNHSLTTTFAALTAPGGTPYWWLAYYGLTNGGFAAAEAAYTNAAGLTAWQTYAAGLNPTNPVSQFVINITRNNGEVIVQFPTVVTMTNQDPLAGNRYYSLENTTNLVSGPWVPAPNWTDVGAAPGLTVYYTNETSMSELYYRAKVYLGP